MDYYLGFQCDSAVCKHDFEDFVRSEDANTWEKKKELTVECPECGKTAHLLFNQVSLHGHNHSSWAVASTPKVVKKQETRKANG